jgi:TonB dependent receptor/TonB-dependent Receptor Plug Domain
MPAAVQTRLALAARAALAAGSALALPAFANHGGPVTGAPQTIIIQGRHYDNAIGTQDAASAGTIRRELLESRPAQRPGEVLEFVPGVIVTQHSGDGKANQYFLRGFNLDHGTDFSTRINGMPVNMPTHGHGQGYSDMNFLLPELVDRVEYRKGPYFATVGDFAAAGSADIRYLHSVAAPFAQVTLGENGYRRGVAGGSGTVAPGITALGALEALNTDGPWTVPERVRKLNGLFTLSGGTRARGWHVSAMGYRSHWTATDQVPQRLIDAGSLNGQPFGRFDSLDPSTGGDSRRSSLSADWHNDGPAGRTQISAYALRYALDLNSNFSYALERPADGDQFKQTDRRSVYGVDAEHTFNHDIGEWPARTVAGLQLRHDRIRVGLYDSVERRITKTVRDDAVHQTQLGLFAQTSVEIRPELRAVLGLRADRLQARVDALSLPANGGRAHDSLLSPKFTLVWAVTPKTELFLNAGRGFHSNDARGMTATIDPRTGNPVDAVPVLVPLTGTELGLRTEAVAGLQSSVSLWGLRSASELVYIGDAGGTEASLGSRRRGIEFSNRWQPLPWFLLDADFAFSHARLNDGSRIPNAIDRVASVAGTLKNLQGWTASLQWRYLGAGALVEDNSVRSLPSSTFNLRVTRSLGSVAGARASVTLDVFNLFDRKVNDIQYFYESRLPGEAAPVADRHVHPAEPRNLRLTLQASF